MSLQRIHTFTFLPIRGNIKQIRLIFLTCYQSRLTSSHTSQQIANRSYTYKYIIQIHNMTLIPYCLDLLLHHGLAYHYYVMGYIICITSVLNVQLHIDQQSLVYLTITGTLSFNVLSIKEGLYLNQLVCSLSFICILKFVWISISMIQLDSIYALSSTDKRQIC